MSGTTGGYSNIIKEFLSVVRWQVEEEAQRTFVRDMEKLTAFVTLQAGLIEAAITKAASALEQFYFQSQRTGASVEGLKALGYAASQVGVNAADMRNALEGLASFMRSSPGAAGYLKRLGIDTESNGHLRDTADIFEDLRKRLNAMPFYQARQYGSIFGFDERQLLAMRKDLGGFEAEYGRMVREAGLNQEEAASHAHDFMVQVRSLGAALKVLGDLVTDQLTKRLGADVAHIRDLIEKNFQRIAKVITTVATAFITFLDTLTTLALRVGQVISAAMDWWDRLDTSTRRVAEGFGVLLTAWRLLSAGFLTSPLGLLITAFAALLLLIDDYEGHKEGKKSLIDWKKYEPQIEAVRKGITGFLSEIDTKVKEYFGPDGWQKVLSGFATYLETVWLIRMATSLGKVLQMLSILPGSGVTRALLGGVAAMTGLGIYLGMNVGAASLNANDEIFGPHASPDTKNPERDKTAKESWDFWKSKGYTDQGAAAMLGQEEGESGFNKDATNPSGTSRGSFQWSKERRDAILNALNIDVWSSATTHAQHLQAMEWEMNGGDAGSAAVRDGIKYATSIPQGVMLGVTGVERSKNQTSDIGKRSTFAYDWQSYFAGGPKWVPGSHVDEPMTSEQYAAMSRMADLRDAIGTRHAAIRGSALGARGRSLVSLANPINQGAGAQLNQTNNFNIHGTSDPQATAMRVAPVLRTVNSDFVRNLGGNSQ